MNKLMTLSLIAAVALISNQAFAQCASCAGGSAPVFSQSQSYSAPVNYGYSAPMNYGAPSYSQSYGTPIYSTPATYGTPIYSTPAVSYATSYSHQPVYSQPVYSQSGCSACSGTVVSQPIYSQPMSYGCNNCCAGCGGGNVVMHYSSGSNIYDGSSMGGTIIDGGVISSGEGSVVEGSVIESGAPVEGSSNVVTPPVNTDIATPPVPQPEPKASNKETAPTPDNGDDT